MTDPSAAHGPISDHNQPDHRPAARDTSESRSGGHLRNSIWPYSIGMFGTSLPINMIKGSMLLYYVDMLGLDVRAYGIVMTFYAVLDAIDNPILGFFSDRTRSRFGRRKPWLVIGATTLCACFVGFFSAPTNLTGMGLVIWFTVFAIGCEAMDSMVNANYQALLPELFPHERKRARANSLRQGFQLVAMVVSLALTPLLTTQVLGTEQTTIGFTRTAAIYAGLALVVMLFMTFSVTENPHYEQEQRAQFFSSIIDIAKTKLFWQIGVATACYLMPLTLVLAGAQLFVKYSLGLPVSYALYLEGVVIIVTAAALIGWTKLVQAHGSPAIWRWGFVLLAAGFVPLFFARTLITAIGCGCIIGLGWSALLATNDLIQSRLLDDDARRNGVHREGIFFSAFGFFTRIAGLLNGWAMASLGALFGYYSGDNPGTNPGMAFRVYMCVYPCLIALAGAVLARFVRVPEAGAGAIDEAAQSVD